MYRILLVEDDAMNSDMLSRRLERKGYVVSVAHDGRESLALAREQNPDMILMDMSLPDITGCEATRRLKSAPDTCGIPVVALTAYATASDREEAIGAGCDEYETKPIELPRLIEKIEGILGRKRLVQDTQ